MFNADHGASLRVSKWGNNLAIRLPDAVVKALDLTQELLGPARALTAAVHAHAVESARVRKPDFYDALILSAAADAGCAEVPTENMRHGSTVGGVTVRNPFL